MQVSLGRHLGQQGRIAKQMRVHCLLTKWLGEGTSTNTMAAHDNLSEYQFRFRPTGPQQYYPGYFHDLDKDESLWDYDVTAVHKPTGRAVGEFLYRNDGLLFQVNVDDDHQRKGVATEMAKKAFQMSQASNRRFPTPIQANSETEPEGRLYREAMQRKGYMRWDPESQPHYGEDV